MTLHVFNPLSEARWDNFVAKHPRATVFHEPGWLEALARTYRYDPFVFTSAPPGQELTDGIVFCRISSWITGRRLVSLPFSDHCDPLLADQSDFSELTQEILREIKHLDCEYFELRPLLDLSGQRGLTVSHSYCFHDLDLRPSMEQLYRNLHNDSIRRKIRRAEKENLSYEVGRSEQLLKDFYWLLLRTRRRQQLPPQPRDWFRNVLKFLGDNAQIRLVRKQNRPIAALLTLKCKSTITYKYGCSDERCHHLGGMPFLFWQLMQESKYSGTEKIDFGRSDLDKMGLIAFKDKLGTHRSGLTYYRHPGMAIESDSNGWFKKTVRHLFSVLPNPVLSGAGRLLYRHIG